ncbi:hypothetical protein VC83_04443 [Pseudogymnoascus destructans]|uniref:Uncharacterized protein n=1 Tax=Pseudogymnoascus destructans TaxID=655981 RepID=A0A177AA88_9PEZI|nr:uncharacterized protein VC83_04443 [Pseudogymnoascus destructans]OAF59046.1 hypothetical protein VC83_04443 [Pseudogymnoascus destructans]
MDSECKRQQISTIANTNYRQQPRRQTSTTATETERCCFQCCFSVKQLVLDFFSGSQHLQVSGFIFLNKINPSWGLSLYLEDAHKLLPYPSSPRTYKPTTPPPTPSPHR